MSRRFNIVRTVNDIGEEVDLVLESRNKEKYFEGIVLLYSFIENLLKWLIFVKIIWGKSDRVLHPDEVEKLRSFCRRLDFFTALNAGLSLDLIDLSLYRRIDRVRRERNDLIHQLWIYDNRRNSVILRKILERLARVARRMAEVMEQLTSVIGVEDIYEIAL